MVFHTMETCFRYFSMEWNRVFSWGGDDGDGGAVEEEAEVGGVGRAGVVGDGGGEDVGGDGGEVGGVFRGREGAGELAVRGGADEVGGGAPWGGDTEGRLFERDRTRRH